jgi:transcriptional regulator of acetoin/glycerol metabolism
VSSVDQTLDEVAHASAGSRALTPILYVVLEADRPLARGARYSLVGVEQVTLGRGPSRVATRSPDGKTLDLRLPGQWLSSQHASVRAVGSDFIVEDAGSRNGTFVHGERITSHVLREGDVVETGRVFLSVRGAPAHDGPIVRDEDASRTQQPFGLRTLLPELHDAQAALARVARNSAVPVLFLGPTGSGKEVLARQVHAQSGRAGPFIAVNCGALPQSLVEGLLFGHVKGAFSGAARDELGFVRSADGGTLFLDEIGDLPATSQAALLRVLQEHEVIPIGATRPVKVDVRVVAATHRPLERLTFAQEAARALLAYSWPLNIRELHQAMASAVALASADVIEASHLPVEVMSPPPPPPSAPVPSRSNPSPDELLRNRIVALLHEHQGNVTAVARAFGKAPAQIHRWMHRFQIDPDTYRPGGT